jgi:glutamate racemase
MHNKPIGVFDSGLGGLTVVKEIVEVLPGENIVYLGDTARVPYGTRSREVVTKFSGEDVEFLLRKGVKCIVIACNTASAFAFEYLKNKYNIPIFNVITPTSKNALEHTKSNIIGVIGTRGTIDSKAYDIELKRNKNVKIYSKACPLFVPLIEEGEIEGNIIKGVVAKYLSYFKDKNIDTLILGCTHYPVIEKELVNYLGNKINYINPGTETAKDLKIYLKDNNLLNNSSNKGNISYYVTDINNRFKETAEVFFKNGISKKIVKVQID